MNYDFVVKVLDFFYSGDMRDCLLWTTRNGVLKFHVDCSDMFDWGCSDSEELTPENFHILEESLRDVDGIGCFHIYSTYLFACRIRKARPGPHWFLYKDKDEKAVKLRQLFEACGPGPVVDVMMCKEK